MMPSSKKLQTREKNLLIVVVLVAVVVFLSQVVFIPHYEKMIALQAKLEEVKTTASDIDIQIAMRNSIKNRISENLEEINASSEKYFPTIIQEKIILFLNAEIDKLDIIASYNFTETTPQEIDAVFEPIGRESFVLDDMAQAYKAKNEQVEEVELEDVEEAEDKTVVYISNDNNKIDVAMVTIDYVATYDNLVKLISRIEDYPKKVIVTSLSATVDKESELLSGNLTLEFYGLPKLEQQESDKGYLTWDIINSYGRINPFEPLSYEASESIEF